METHGFSQGTGFIYKECLQAGLKLVPSWLFLYCYVSLVISHKVAAEDTFRKLGLLRPLI